MALSDLLDPQKLIQLANSEQTLRFIFNNGSKYLLGLMLKSVLLKEPDFKKMIYAAKDDAKKIFQDDFKDVELFNDSDFDNLIESTAQLYLSNKNEITGMADALSQQIEKQSLIYHENAETKAVYAKSYAKYFCLYFYARLANHPKYSSILMAQEAFAESSFRQTVNQKLDVVMLGIETIVAKNMEANGASNILLRDGSSTFIDLNENLLTDEEDKYLEELFKKIDELNKEDDAFREQIKIANEILLRAPPQKTILYSKSVNTLLSCHLRGKSDDWTNGLKEAERYSENLNSYSYVLIAALNNNLKRWEIGNKFISNISRSDLLTFSEKQKNSYYVISALLKYHIGEHEKAAGFLDSCTDKTDSEFIHISFAIAGYQQKTDLLPKALEVLSDKKSSIALIASASNYTINCFVIYQKEFGNALDALSNMRPYLDLAFVRARDILSENPESTSLPRHELFLMLPSLARLLGRSKEILDMLSFGLNKKIDDYIFLHNAAACFQDANSIEFALKCYEKIPLLEMVENQGIDLYIYLIRKSKKSEKLVDILRQVQQLKIAEIKKWPSILSISMEIGGQQFFVLANEAFEKFPNEAWCLLAKAESYIQQDNFKEGISLLEKASNEKEFHLLANVRLAKLYASTLKDPLRALPYYEEVVKPEAPINEKYEYVLCLYQLDKFGDVIKKVDEFDPNFTVMKLQTLKSYACSELGMLKEAQKILAAVCEIEKDDHVVHFNHAALCQNLGLISELSVALKNAVRIKPDDYKSHLMLSQSLFNQGRLGDAITHAKFALLGEPEKEANHLNYINMCMIASNSKDEKFSLSQENEDLFKDSFSKFTERFPDSKLLRKIELPKNQEGQIDIDFFKKIASENQDRHMSFLDTYKKNSSPVGFLKLGLQLDTYEVWCALVNNTQSIGLRVNHCDLEKIITTLPNFESAEKIIVDGLMLLTFNSFGLLDSLKKLNKKICVSSETAKEFLKIKHRLQSSNQGYMTIGMQNEKLVRDSISGTQIKNAISFIDTISYFIKDTCEVIALDRSYKIPEKDRVVLQILDLEYKELWGLNAANKIASVWLDSNLSELAQTLGYSAYTIQTLAIYMHRSKCLTDDQYAILIGEMVLANYEGIIFSPKECALFIKSNLGIRGEIFLGKIFTGPFFNDSHSRLLFISKVVFQLFMNKISPEWLSKVIKRELEAPHIEEHNRVLFCISIYNLAIKLSLDTTEVDAFVESLVLKFNNGDLISPSVCKGFIEHAYVLQKQQEVDEFKEKLGIPEE